MPEIPIQIRLMAAERSAAASGARAVTAAVGGELRRFASDFPDFQLVTITKVLGGGFFNVRTRSGATRKRVRAITDSDWWDVGLVVVMGHYDRDKDQPYLRNAAGREKRRLVYVWSQGQGDPNCIPLFRGVRASWAVENATVLSRTGCQTLGVVIVGTVVYWLYADALNTYILEAVSTNGSTLWLTTLGRVSLLQRLDLCWGYLFYDQAENNLVVLSPESDRRSWKIDLKGVVLASQALEYNLSQCGVRGGWIIKGWHYPTEVDAGNGNGQWDSLIRGLPLGSGTAWSWSPTAAIPVGLEERARIVATGRAFNPFGGSSAALEEGRWPISETGVAVHVAGWQELEDSGSSRMIDRSPESIRCVTQFLPNPNAGRTCWASAALLGLQTGEAAWLRSQRMEASEELLTDTASFAHWSAALTELPGRAIVLDSVFARDLGSATPPDYLSMQGIFHYAGVAETLALDRTEAFIYREYVDDNPSNGPEDRTGKYQHSIGSPFLFGDPVPRAVPGSFKRPEREYFHVPHIRLLPLAACHMERGSEVYPDGEDIVDSPEGSWDARKDAPHQVVIDDDGRVYRCVQRPVPVFLGGPFCLPVFRDDEEIIGSIVVGYDSLGQPQTITTQGWQKHWHLYQVGAMKQSWSTWLECYGPAGELEWEEDISYRFPVTYRGKRVS